MQLTRQSVFTLKQLLKLALVEWSFPSCVVIIDPSRAPVIVKAMVDSIADMPEFEAEQEVLVMFDLFGESGQQLTPPASSLPI